MLQKFSFLIFVIYGMNLNAQEAEYPHNAFYPGEIWEDSEGNHINAHGGGIKFQDGTYYWYGEHKGNNSKAHVGINVYSSKDLYNWKKEGVALGVEDDPDSEITAGSVMERPKVVYNEKTKQYVMWFHLELKGQGYAATRTGLAVSDNPTGPFKYLKSFRPNAEVWPKDFKEEWKETPEKDDPEDVVD